MKFTVLLTCVGGEYSPHVIQKIKASLRHDIRVVGVDMRENAVGRHFVDAFATVPRGGDPGYVPAIARIAERESANLILATSDEEAVALATRRGEIERAGRVLASASTDVVLTLADKARTYARLEKAGLGAPLWHLAHEVGQVPDLLDQVLKERGEAVVKPSASRGGRGVFVITMKERSVAMGARETHLDRDTFLQLHLSTFASNLPAIVMERLVEPVFDVDILGWQGKPVRVVPRRRVNSALPNEGHVLVDDGKLLDLGTRLIAELDLSWLYDCDVMLDREGNPRVLEINPRPSGSIATTISAGVPLLDDLVSLALGQPVPEVAVPFGAIVIPYKSLVAVR